MNLIINADGASRGNPGPASYGFVIRQSDGPILHQEGQVIGKATNNVAEYMAVLSALLYIKKYIKGKQPHKIEVITDSQLIARQLDGSFKIKNENLKKLYYKIKSVEPEVGFVFYKNVPREQNFIADRLANKALDEAGSR
jgi:ribonuclease HI